MTRRIAVAGLLGLVIAAFGSEARCGKGHGAVLDRLIARSGQLERDAAEKHRQRFDEYGIELGSWYAIGPFKHEQFGHAPDSLAFEYDVERDVLAAEAGAADLEKTYHAERYPGMLDTVRRWRVYPHWTDGYRHMLPRGPAPARGEAVYLYRTISCRSEVAAAMRLYAEDYLAAWLNGVELARAHRGDWSANRFPTALRVDLPLQEGENRLLIKVASLCGDHGFAFSLEGLTPTNDLLPGQWHPSIRRDQASTNFAPGHLPLTSEEPPAVTYPRWESSAEAEAFIARQLQLPADEVAAMLAGTEGERTAALAREAADFADALARLRAFRFDITMTPMFDPPRSVMAEEMDRMYEASPGGRDYLAGLARLRPVVEAALEKAEKGRPGAAAAVLAAYEQLESMWRRAAAKLPPILFIRRPYVRVDARAPYSCGGSTPSALCVFDPAAPGQPARVLFEEPGTAIYDMCLDFDAEHIYFSARRRGVEGGWHIYRIDRDGGGLTQITRGPSDNISPCVLPGGQLAFVSTREQNYVTCAPRKAGHLFLADADGGNVRKASANIDSDHTPRVLEDGRILFTRWDYGIEKNVFARHALWTVNPDATGLELFFGKTIEDPAAFWKARQVPGRPVMVCVFGPHHTHQSGMIGLVWNQRGAEAPRGEGFRFITDEIPAYADITFPFGYEDPYPLNERQFLVTYGGDGGQKARLYLLDDRGNRRCLYEATGGLGCYHPLPLAPRQPPSHHPPRSTPHPWSYREPFERKGNPDDSLTATLFLADVYRGLAPHVARGEAKYLQILEQLPKPVTHHLDAWGTSPLTGRGTVHVRRLIGTVPLADDGSAYFEAPALRSISFNALNAEGKLLMRMGSDIHLMPGEHRSCVGCHEVKEGGYTAPPAAPFAAALARGRRPVQPESPDWGTAGLIDYQRVIQPIWDRYCVECHSGALPEGGVDMTGDRTRYFCASYDNLIERELVEYHNVFALDHDETPVKAVGSYVSRIAEYIDTPEHAGKQMTDSERRAIYTWIDANVPYYATYRFTRVETAGSRDAWSFSEDLFETFDRRCMGCHRREMFNPSLYGGAAVVSSSLWTNRGITAHGFPRRWPETAHIGPELRINLTNPGHSLLLRAPLAEAAGGFGYCLKDGEPVFASEADPDYQRMLAVIENAKRNLYFRPRVDMPPEHIAAVLPTVVPAEPVGWWTFDTIDAGVTPNHGTGGRAMDGVLAGNALLQRNVSDGVRTSASALYLEGRNNEAYVDVGHGVTQLGSAGFTIMAWIRTAEPGLRGMSVLSKSPNHNAQWDTGGQMAWYIPGGEGGDATPGGISYVGYGRRWIHGDATKVNDGAWRHVAVVRHPGDRSAAVYIDGELQTGTITFTGGSDAGGTVRIGWSEHVAVPGYWDKSFHGWIDDFRIYDTPLGAAEVRAAMDSGQVVNLTR